MCGGRGEADRFLETRLVGVRGIVDDFVGDFGKRRVGLSGEHCPVTMELGWSVPQMFPARGQGTGSITEWIDGSWIRLPSCLVAAGFYSTSGFLLASTTVTHVSFMWATMQLHLEFFRPIMLKRSTHLRIPQRQIKFAWITAGADGIILEPCNTRRTRLPASRTAQSQHHSLSHDNNR